MHIPKGFSEIERTYLDEIPIIQIGYSITAHAIAHVKPLGALA
jgi:hypothetical protein